MSAEIECLSELINVGRGNSMLTIISLQSVAQLYDTYSKARGQALLLGMTTSVILGLADGESVEYARQRIGAHWEEYTGHVEKRPGIGGGQVTVDRETRLEKQHDFAEGDFSNFAAGECVVCRQGEGWVYGRVRLPAH